MSTDTHARRLLSSSKCPNWRTPQWLYEALDTEFRFILDAAANTTDHKHGFYLGPGSHILEDALCGVSWASVVRELLKSEDDQSSSVFFNPPYSVKLFRETGDPAMLIDNWARVGCEAGEDVTTVGIFPFSPQTKWWRMYIEGDLYRAAEIRKFPYRIKFDPPPDYDGDAPGSNVNTAVVIWRPESKYFLEPWAPHTRYYDPRASKSITGVVDNGDED